MNAEETLATDHYSDIGTLLRSAREQMRLPIDQAGRMLHIRVRYLDALEQGRLSELPGLTYTRGYLQAYAVFLGLDKDEILRRFEEVERMLARKTIYFPQVFSKQKTPDRTIIWGSLAAALVIYGLWVLVFQPPSVRISMVEKLAERQNPKPHSVAGTEEAACLQTQDGLYPPCTTIRVPEFDLVPLHKQLKSVMELATPSQ